MRHFQQNLGEADETLFPDGQRGVHRAVVDHLQVLQNSHAMQIVVKLLRCATLFWFDQYLLVVQISIERVCVLCLSVCVCVCA